MKIVCSGCGKTMEKVNTYVCGKDFCNFDCFKQWDDALIEKQQNDMLEEVEKQGMNYVK